MKMKAVVLSGGFATRLRPISYALPKLLFPVAGKPMIYWTLDLLQKYGVDHVVLAVNYLADQLRAKVGEKYGRMRISYSLEDHPLGTGGPIKLASRRLKPKSTFIAMNGDIITDIDLKQMLTHHKESKATVTDALHEVHDPTRFGVVQLDAEKTIRTAIQKPISKILRFIEKPVAEEAPSRLINAGIYLIEPETLTMIPSGRKVSLEREIFPVLAGRGRLFGFRFKGQWYDIGDFSDYRKANFELLKNRTTPRPLKKSRIKDPVLLGSHSRAETAVNLGPNVITGRNCTIRRGAQIDSSILFDDVVIGESSVISGAIIASNASIGRKVKIGRGVIVSSNVRISDDVKVGDDAVIHPHKEITANVPQKGNIM